MKELVLIIWLIVDLIRDLFCLGGAVYLVIWRHCSGWWIALAIVLCIGDSLYKSLRNYFDVKSTSTSEREVK
jgi:hypothetical protein